MTDEQEPVADKAQAPETTRRPMPQGSPLFSAPAVQTPATRADARTIAPAFANSGNAQPAPQQPGAPSHSRDSYAEALAQQVAGQAVTSEQDKEWHAAGLGPHDGYLIEQCKRNGLTPQDLRIRVDGRTLASRLKNGESISSVRSRIA